ncbi:MAG TPA: V-type ATPase subunit [Gemmatimonadaceae bacterium]|nr:V-type ATPase subunit [Gemmatimonadaceae bacterium]
MKGREALVTRARGLSTHLLPASALGEMAALSDLRALADALVQHGYLTRPPDAPPATARDLELAIRRAQALCVATLVRWCPPPRHELAPLLEDEDVRSLRAIIRGAAAGEPALRRLAGLMPTPSLPAAALDELAALDDLGAIAATLAAWGHPFARPVLDASRRPQADLFALEQEVVRTWAERAVRAARHADDALRRYVRATVDRANRRIARVLALHRVDAAAGSLFIPGGEAVRMDDLVTAQRSHDAQFLDARLSPMLPEFRRRALQEPLSLAPVVTLFLRLRQERHALLRIIWGIALGMPPRLRTDAPLEVA